MNEIHSCSYYCHKPECIKAQRDELREKLAKQEQGEIVSKMTARRAEMFMSRFKHEEKMLGPNEQAALDYVIDILVAKQEQGEHLVVRLPSDWPTDDFGKPIIYDTQEVDEVTVALTGDEGEEDSLTVLHGMAAYVKNVWPEKNALQVIIEHEEAMTASTTPQLGPLTDGATVAGLQASIGILSQLVDVQRQLLVEVEDVCGRDGHGGPLEDGESDLIDRVRAQIAAIAAPAPQQRKPLTGQDYSDIYENCADWDEFAKAVSAPQGGDK